MSSPLLHAFVSVVLAVVVTNSAIGAEPSVKAHACAAVTDPTQRLTCYDTAFPPVAGAKSGTVDLEAERERALREFGLNKVQLRVRDPERMREIAPDRIEAMVARVTNRPTGERVVTLDSGQIWLLTEVTSKGHLTSGDRVVIREAALGSFMLVTPKRVPLRAKRIK
jgi:hypothetical protein